MATLAEMHAAHVADRRDERRARLAGSTPSRELLGWLRDYRDGRDGGGTGRSFSDAWREAIARACDPAEPDGSVGDDISDPAWRPLSWRQIFEAQRDAWERAWDRGPQTDAEWKLRAARDEGGRVELDEDLEETPDRVCAICAGSRGSMEGRPPQARLCGHRDCEAERKARSRRKPSNVTRSRGEVARAAGASSRERMAA